MPSKSIEERKSQDSYIRQRGKFEFPLSEISIGLNFLVENKINPVVPSDYRPRGSELTASSQLALPALSEVEGSLPKGSRLGMGVLMGLHLPSRAL